MMSSNRCNLCGRTLLAGMVCLHAVAHPFDHPHDHTRSPGEGFMPFGKVAVSSATTQQAVTMPAIATSLGTVTIRFPLPSAP